MSDVIPVNPATAKSAWIDQAKYRAMYAQSVSNPDAFWGEQGKNLDWFKPYTKVKNTSFEGDVVIRWFEDGELNVTTNCIDRHLEKRGDQVAIIWEGDDPSQQKKITYRALHTEVCRFANVLKAHGVKKGHCVTIYMPMIVEAAYAMLACARIGAVHSVVFGGFSPDSLRDRILDCGSTILITADEGLRGGKKIPLKANADAALKQCPDVKTVITVRHTDGKVEWKQGRDVWYHDEVAKVDSDCVAEVMKAEDPLFILYTSGSTGKPKGVLHTTGGYLLYASLTHKYVFDYHDGDVYWCTADIGWVTVDVRRCADLSRCFALLASDRQTSGDDFLYRANSHSCPDA
jgi:acetyl-CoA synthetase